MQLRPLGRTGLKISPVCLGTMTWGDQNDEAEAFRQMDYALDRGINFFDAAELYSIPPKPDTAGSTERIIGAWFKARGRRQDVVLATKIAGRSPMTWLRREDTLDGGLTRHTRKQIDFAVEGSLKRLGVETIDLYQLHWPDRGYNGFGQKVFADYPQDWAPFEEILEALAVHVKAGRIRAIGVSNESPWGVMRFLAASDALGLPRMASIQNAYNLVNRTAEMGLAEVCLREDVSFLAYSPLAQGYLTGKYRHGALPVGSRKTLFNRLSRYEGPGAEDHIHRYVDKAADFGLTPEGFALKFCATRAFMGSVIIGATSMAQLETDLAAFDVVWTPEMETAADALHLQMPNPCP